MSAVFIITLVLLAGIAYTIYRRQQRHASGSDDELYAALPRPLFATHDAEESARQTLLALAETKEHDSRHAMLERAAQGDLSSLTNSQQSDDPALYRDVLGALVLRVESLPEEMNALVEFVCANDNLRGSVELSRAYGNKLTDWSNAASVARGLHLAALSDDAGEFARVLDQLIAAWRARELPTLSAEDLRALVESEFWVMNAEARASGAAFVVKQLIAALREASAARS